MKKTLLTAAVAAFVASTATAEGISHIRLSYDYQSNSGVFGDPVLGFFQGSIDYEINQFVLGATYENTSVSSDLGDGDAQDINIWGAYVVSPEIIAGGGLLQQSSDDDDTTAFEVFGQYTTASFGVAGNHTLLEDDDSVTTLFGQYTFNPNVTLGAIVSTNSIDDGTGYRFSVEYKTGPIDARAYVDGNSELDGNVFGLRGHYEIGSAFRVGAAYETSIGTEFEDRALQFGGGYSFTEGVWLDASVGQIDLDSGAAVDVLRVLFTYETGTRARLDATMAQDVSDDIWSGVTPIFLFSFDPI